MFLSHNVKNRESERRERKEKRGRFIGAEVNISKEYNNLN